LTEAQQPTKGFALLWLEGVSINKSKTLNNSSGLMKKAKQKKLL